MKPYSEACEQNKYPILNVLEKALAEARTLLEIGSGTGQHAVFFAHQLPHVTWQPSDCGDYLAGIQLWLDEAKLPNIAPLLELDVSVAGHWPDRQYDAVFSANTTHIMSWSEVEMMFTGIGRILRDGGLFCLYGPFNYHGEYTSESNARFDGWLKQRDPLSGVRDVDDLHPLAAQHGLQPVQDYAMPANNRTLVWRKQNTS
jgi:cyclopropane fatty-acyl-phospholipid synthase-like methyltransferase